jgi:tRNA threonylcarbamoyladenosine biosynthesis protein TsaB
MLVLAIDTATPGGGLAILEDSRILGIVSTQVEETYSSRLFRHLEFLLTETRLELGSMDLFAVSAGPGSFSGLRIGLTAVKGWAEVLAKPIATVSGLEAVAAQARSERGLLAPVLDARRGQVYFGFYRRIGASEENCLALDGEECVIAPEQLLETVQARAATSDLAIVTPAREIISGAMSHCESNSAPARTIPVHQVSAILAPHVGRLGYLRAKRGEVVDALTLDANYIRRTDAELHWKEPAAS